MSLHVPHGPHGRLASNPNISEKRMVCPGGRRARPRTLRLEGHPQAKLDQAWKIVLASYLTKAGSRYNNRYSAERIAGD